MTQKPVEGAVVASKTEVDPLDWVGCGIPRDLQIIQLVFAVVSLVSL